MNRKELERELKEEVKDLVDIVNRYRCPNGCVEPYVGAFKVDRSTLVVCTGCGRKVEHETGRVIVAGKCRAA